MIHSSIESIDYKGFQSITKSAASCMNGYQNHAFEVEHLKELKHQFSLEKVKRMKQKRERRRRRRANEKRKKIEAGIPVPFASIEHVTRRS